MDGTRKSSCTSCINNVGKCSSCGGTGQKQVYCGGTYIATAYLEPVPSGDWKLDSEGYFKCYGCTNKVYRTNAWAGKVGCNKCSSSRTATSGHYCSSSCAKSHVQTYVPGVVRNNTRL